MQISNRETREFFTRMLQQAGGDMRIVEQAMDAAVREKDGRPVSEEDVSREINVIMNEPPPLRHATG